MGFLCSLSFLTYYDRVCIMRVQEQIRNDLNISEPAMGWIMGAFWLAYGLFEIPSGWIGDRFGARTTLARIVLAWSLFTALSGSAVGFWSLLAYRFLFGVGEAGAYPNMARVQSRWLPTRTRGRWGGVLWLMARWGGAFSPIIIGLMLRGLDAPAFRTFLGKVPGLSMVAGTASWRLAFWISGLLGVVWVALFFPFFRDRPEDKRTVNDAEVELIRAGRTAEERHTMPRGLWVDLFTSPSLWAIALLYLFGSFGWSFFVSWMPKYFQAVHGIPFAKSEWISAMPLFFGGISCLVGGTLSDLFVRRTGRKRLGRALFPITGLTTSCACMAAIPFVREPMHAVALLCVANAAFDFGQGANWASIVDIGGSYAGTATGFINMIGNMGNFLQPPIGALIFTKLGWNWLFGVYATMFFLAASMWLIIDPARKFYRDEGDAPPPTAGFPVVIPAAQRA
jgi:MFS family permease